MTENITPYMEELVYVSTSDGLLLEGVLVRPRGVPIQPLSFVWIHGNAARFYDYAYVAICRALAGAGYPCVSGNTRGHDVAAFLWRGDADQPRPWRGPQDMPIGGGAGWERLEDAPVDVGAWVALAAGLAGGGVVLAGHSSGAQRVVLYQAERQDAQIKGIALASPDLRGFMAPGELSVAQQMMAEDRGNDVVPAQPWAPFYRQSAASVVNRAEVLARLQSSGVRAIHCPVLALVGAREPGAANILEAMAGQFPLAPRVDTATVADADHAYTGCATDVANVVATWAATLTT